MTNLGSDDTPVKGENFSLPAGAQIDEDGGELVVRDSAGEIILRRDETAGNWNFEGGELRNIGSVNTEDAQIKVLYDDFYRAAGFNTLGDLFSTAGDNPLVVELPVETVDEHVDLSTRTAPFTLRGAGHRSMSRLNNTQTGDVVTVGDENNKINGVLLEDIGSSGSNSDGAWVRYQNAQNFVNRNLYITDVEHAFVLEQQGGRLIDSFFEECIAEHCTSTGILFDVMQVASGRNIRRSRWVGGYSYGNAGYGLRLKGRGIQDNRWIGMEFGSNDGAGVLIEGAVRSQFVGCWIHDNGKNATNPAEVVITDDADGNRAPDTIFTGCGFSADTSSDDFLRLEDTNSNVFIVGGIRQSGNITTTGAADQDQINMVGVSNWNNYEVRRFTSLDDGTDVDISGFFDDNLSAVTISSLDRAVIAGATATGDTTFRPFLTDEAGNTLTGQGCRVTLIGATHPSQ